MNSHTATVVVSAPKAQLYSYLANIENLPRWATEFAQSLKQVDGKHKVVTPMGELFIEIRADEKTGVIDMLAGPTESQMGALPTRVVEISEDTSAFIFTLFQTPDLSDEVFEGQFASVNRELANVKRHFEG